MADLNQTDVRNRLLRALPPDVFRRLKPHFRPMQVQLRQTLAATGGAMQDLYFPEAGIVSVTSDGTKARVEIALIGREGLVGAVPFLLGDARAPHTYFIQLAGSVLTIDGATLLAETERSVPLRRVLHHYIQTQFVQTAQAAFANARGRTEIRLARWLLMCQDRTDGNVITVTQEFMSYMLGVERPGVTAALSVLKRKSLIETQRGAVSVVDRAGLIELAGDTYGFPEAEYARLIGG